MLENGESGRSELKTTVSSTTTSWSKLKDPRVVRTSHAYGGKDRHSKVFTVRGLRDRRVRLSVQTAIQLYDLQDRLGLNQPSKVVDWLLNAAKREIDELPPLHFPQGSFFEQQPFLNHEIMGVNHSDNVAPFPFMTLSYPPRGFDLGSGNEEFHWQNSSVAPAGVANQMHGISSFGLPYFHFDSKHFNFQGDTEMEGSSQTLMPLCFNMATHLLPFQRNNHSS